MSEYRKQNIQKLYLQKSKASKKPEDLEYDLYSQSETSIGSTESEYSVNPDYNNHIRFDQSYGQIPYSRYYKKIKNNRHDYDEANHNRVYETGSEMYDYETDNTQYSDYYYKPSEREQYAGNDSVYTTVESDLDYESNTYRPKKLVIRSHAHKKGSHIPTDTTDTEVKSSRKNMKVYAATLPNTYQIFKYSKEDYTEPSQTELYSEPYSGTEEDNQRHNPEYKIYNMEIKKNAAKQKLSQKLPNSSTERVISITNYENIPTGGVKTSMINSSPPNAMSKVIYLPVIVMSSNEKSPNSKNVHSGLAGKPNAEKPLENVQLYTALNNGENSIFRKSKENLPQTDNSKMAHSFKNEPSQSSAMTPKSDMNIKKSKTNIKSSSKKHGSYFYLPSLIRTSRANKTKETAKTSSVAEKENHTTGKKSKTKLTNPKSETAKIGNKPKLTGKSTKKVKHSKSSGSQKSYKSYKSVSSLFNKNKSKKETKRPKFNSSVKSTEKSTGKPKKSKSSGSQKSYKSYKSVSSLFNNNKNKKETKRTKSNSNVKSTEKSTGKPKKSKSSGSLKSYKSYKVYAAPLFNKNKSKKDTKRPKSNSSVKSTEKSTGKSKKPKSSASSQKSYKSYKSVTSIYKNIRNKSKIKRSKLNTNSISKESNQNKRLTSHSSIYDGKKNPESKRESHDNTLYQQPSNNKKEKISKTGKIRSKNNLESSVQQKKGDLKVEKYVNSGRESSPISSENTETSNKYKRTKTSGRVIDKKDKLEKSKKKAKRVESQSGSTKFGKKAKRVKSQSSNTSGKSPRYRIGKTPPGSVKGSSFYIKAHQREMQARREKRQTKQDRHEPITQSKKDKSAGKDFVNTEKGIVASKEFSSKTDKNMNEIKEDSTRKTILRKSQPVPGKHPSLSKIVSFGDGTQNKTLQTPEYTHNQNQKYLKQDVPGYPKKDAVSDSVIKKVPIYSKVDWETNHSKINGNQPPMRPLLIEKEDNQMDSMKEMDKSEPGKIFTRYKEIVPQSTTIKTESLNVTRVPENIQNGNNSTKLEKSPTTVAQRMSKNGRGKSIIIHKEIVPQSIIIQKEAVNTLNVPGDIKRENDFVKPERKTTIHGVHNTEFYTKKSLKTDETFLSKDKTSTLKKTNGEQKLFTTKKVDDLNSKSIEGRAQDLVGGHKGAPKKLPERKFDHKSFANENTMIQQKKFQKFVREKVIPNLKFLQKKLDLARTRTIHPIKVYDGASHNSSDSGEISPQEGLAGKSTMKANPVSTPLVGYTKNQLSEQGIVIPMKKDYMGIDTPLVGYTKNQLSEQGIVIPMKKDDVGRNTSNKSTVKEDLLLTRTQTKDNESKNKSLKVGSNTVSGKRLATENKKISQPNVAPQQKIRSVIKSFSGSERVTTGKKTSINETATKSMRKETIKEEANVNKSTSKNLANNKKSQNTIDDRSFQAKSKSHIQSQSKDLHRPGTSEKRQESLKKPSSIKKQISQKKSTSKVTSAKTETSDGTIILWGYNMSFLIYFFQAAQFILGVSLHDKFVEVIGSFHREN